MILLPTEDDTNPSAGSRIGFAVVLLGECDYVTLAMKERARATTTTTTTTMMVRIPNLPRDATNFRCLKFPYRRVVKNVAVRT